MLQRKMKKEDVQRDWGGVGKGGNGKKRRRR
jgi:hypothetical protein